MIAEEIGINLTRIYTGEEAFKEFKSSLLRENSHANYDYEVVRRPHKYKVSITEVMKKKQRYILI